MASTAKKVALGAAATAAIIGGREIVEMAPNIATHVVETAGGRIGSDAGEAAITGTGRIRLNEFSRPLDSGLNGTLRIDRTEFSTLPSRIIVPLNNSNWSVDGITSYFTNAEPRILYDFSKLAPPIPQATADRIIRDELVGIVQAAAKKPASDISFEVLTGKLTVGSATSIAGATISGGEINVYKVSLALAGGVAACNGMVVSDFQSCVQLALAKARSVVADEVKGTTDATAKKE